MLCSKLSTEILLCHTWKLLKLSSDKGATFFFPAKPLKHYMYAIELKLLKPATPKSTLLRQQAVNLSHDIWATHIDYLLTLLMPNENCKL